MANYYYVKNGGTADGSTIDTSATNGIANTKLTGAWSGTASQYFADIEAACENGTNPPTSGDFVMVSDAHYKTFSANEIADIPSGVTIISVSNSNRDQYAKATSAQEANVSPGQDLRYTCTAAYSYASVIGLYLEPYDSFYFSDADQGRQYWEDCTVDISNGSANDLFGIQSETTAILKNCDLIGPSGGNDDCVFRLGFSSSLRMTGGSLSGMYALVDVTTEFADAEFDSVDLSGCDNGLYLAVYRIASSCRLKVHRCKLPATWSAIDTAPSPGMFDIDLTSCDNGDGYHYFYHYRREGEIEEDTVTYRDATYDGTNGFSAVLQPSANAMLAGPLRYKLCTFLADKLPANKQITIHFTCASTLTDTEIFFEAVANDDTTSQAALGEIFSTRPSNILGAGTTYTDDTGNTAGWTSPKAYIYSETLTLTDAPTTGIVEVYVSLIDPTAAKDVWVDPAIAGLT